MIFNKSIVLMILPLTFNDLEIIISSFQFKVNSWLLCKIFKVTSIQFIGSSLTFMKHQIKPICLEMRFLFTFSHEFFLRSSFHWQMIVFKNGSEVRLSLCKDSFIKWYESSSRVLDKIPNFYLKIYKDSGSNKIKIFFKGGQFLKFGFVLVEKSSPYSWAVWRDHFLSGE